MFTLGFISIVQVGSIVENDTHALRIHGRAFLHPNYSVIGTTGPDGCSITANNDLAILEVFCVSCFIVFSWTNRWSSRGGSSPSAWLTKPWTALFVATTFPWWHLDGGNTIVNGHFPFQIGL